MTAKQYKYFDYVRYWPDILIKVCHLLIHIQFNRKSMQRVENKIFWMRIMISFMRIVLTIYNSPQFTVAMVKILHSRKLHKYDKSILTRHLWRYFLNLIYIYQSTTCQLYDKLNAKNGRLAHALSKEYVLPYKNKTISISVRIILNVMIIFLWPYIVMSNHYRSSYLTRHLFFNLIRLPIKIIK